MNDFCLGNYCSINLNFIMYISNLYKNCTAKFVSIFPYVEIDNKYLLNKIDVELKLKECWDEVFNFNNILKDDVQLWIEEKFDYRGLFIVNTDNYEIYEKIKMSFESWYWGTGYSLCNQFSEQYVEIYYNDFLEIYKNTILPNNLIGLQVIYDKIPLDWCNKNKNMFVISPRDILPKAEEIFK